MPVEEFIITVFYLIDDELKNLLKGKRLRQRGPLPGLEDAEVINMEIISEFFGMDCDKTIWRYFKEYWGHFFPKIPDRSNVARQAANLHVVKRLLQENLAASLGAFEGHILAKYLKERLLVVIVPLKRSISMVFEVTLSLAQLEY